MIPIVTPEEMAAVDAGSGRPVSELIAAAAQAVATVARNILTPDDQRPVLVVAGKGNNGADGRAAAELLRSDGVRCEVVAPAELASCAAPLADGTYQLVIDAAFGTGLSRPWNPPPQPAAPVLAVDLPSGVNGLTGDNLGSWQAEHTVTFGALKPAHLLFPGVAQCGEVTLDGIGLAVTAPSAALVTDASAHTLIPTTPPMAHKWQRAVRVVAGSPEFAGAGWLSAAAAMRAGAGAVVVSCPGQSASDTLRPVEAIGAGLSADDWAAEVLADDVWRFKALVVGPGLGRDAVALAQVRELLAGCPLPMVLDADGLAAIATDNNVLAARTAPTVLTPHEGEYTRLMGRAPDADRFAAARAAAQQFGAIVVLKGSTTVVAGPEGQAFAITCGNQRLATAGSGDVLAGAVAACVAGLSSHEVGDAARLTATVAAAAHWHSRTATAGEPVARGGSATESGGDGSALSAWAHLPSRGRAHTLTPLLATDQVQQLAATRALLAQAHQPLEAASQTHDAS